jgi:hypothetical protein
LDYRILSAGYNILGYGSDNGHVCGDAEIVQGNALVGHNTIEVGGYQQTATVYGTAVQLQGSVGCGHNTISTGYGTNTIYGDCYSASGNATGGFNTIHAGVGTATIYGDCYLSAPGAFLGGHNTIYAGGIDNSMCGPATIWGGLGGSDTLVFRPGISQVTIEDFDHHAGSSFNHAQGDIIDLSAYHLSGMPVIGANASGDAVIHLPAAGAAQPGQITLIGVHPFDLAASDFHLV